MADVDIAEDIVEQHNLIKGKVSDEGYDLDIQEE